MHSGEVDAVVLHGFGRAGMDSQETGIFKFFREAEKKHIMGFSDLEREMGLPVFIGNHHGFWESKTISEVNEQGLRVYTRLHDIAWMLSAMAEYWSKKLV